MALSLRCLHLQLDRPEGPLRPAIEAALSGHGRPLRWAITATSGLQLRIEAVVEVEEAVQVDGLDGVTRPEREDAAPGAGRDGLGLPGEQRG